MGPKLLNSRNMKKKIHPYYYPRLIIHTNGSAYVNKLFLCLPSGSSWEVAPVWNTGGDPLGTWLASHIHLVETRDEGAASDLMDRRRKKSSLFSSTWMSPDKGALLIAKSSANASSLEVPFGVSSNRGQPISLDTELNLTSCLVFLKKKKTALTLRAEPAALDVDTFTNPLWKGGAGFHSDTFDQVSDNALSKFKKRYHLLRHYVSSSF